MTFFGEQRWDPDCTHTISKVMTIPMIGCWGSLSLVGGYLLVVNGGVGALVGSVGLASRRPRASTPSGTSGRSALITLVVVAVGAAGAYVVFGQRPVPATQPVGVSFVTPPPDATCSPTRSTRRC